MSFEHQIKRRIRRLAVISSGMLKARRGEAGVTLVELMIAVSLLSVAALGLVATFGAVQRGIQMAKNKTLAANLAQEKMQVLKQQSYFRVLPTVSPSYLADGTPYDTSAFPPETIVEGGVAFQRYTYVEVVTENSGAIDVLSPTTPDTGMRQITVTVAWTERGARELAVKSVMANPNTVEANCVFTGVVKDAATGNPIPNALVTVAENVGWRDSTDGSGGYTIRLSPGSFNLVASAPGYFTRYVYLGIGPNNTVAQDFSLTAMSSGSVVGTAWVNPGPVISQVVLSTVQADGYDVEYVELFNPTGAAYTLSAGGPINLNVVSGHGSLQCSNIPLTYVNATLSPNSYYLIANVSTFTVDGTVYTADAYYTDAAAASCSAMPAGWSPPASRDILQRQHSDTVYITDASGAVLDAVGWTNNGATHVPSYCRGTCIPQPANALPAGDQVVRTSSPSFASASFGRAYNSAGNSLDFAYPGASGLLNITGIAYPPYSTSSGPQTVIAGVPAAGAVISATDGLSAPASAYAVGSPPVAAFALTQVATGAWTVLLTSGSYELENDTVTISATGSVYAFPSSTTLLNGTATAGFIAGTVVDAWGNPISAPSAIQVAGGGQTVTASVAGGSYLLRAPPGQVDVVANPNFGNPSYVSISSLAVTVALGRVSGGVNFVLSQGGRLAGWVTRDGINGLQGATVVATDANGNAQDQQVTDVNGNFKTVNLATGTYTVRIPLDSTETSSPTVRSATALMGQTVSVGTFTISGALGSIAGKVTLGGKPISEGVLVVATTTTLPGGPPALSAATLTSGSYYATSSKEDGTYSLEVRQSTSPAYNVYGYYATVGNSGNVTITAKSLPNVAVTAGQTVSGKDLAW